MDKIESYVERIQSDAPERKELIEEIESSIYGIYGLSKEEIDAVQSSQ